MRRNTSVAIAIAAIVISGVGWGGSAQAAGKSGASHARRANILAAAGKCKQALPEYNTAYRLLHDPALLFNRAECLRKLGRTELAVADYRRFLDELPDAPNRAAVETRIAQLDPSAAPPPAAPRPAAVAPPPAPPPPSGSLRAARLHLPGPGAAAPPAAPPPDPVPEPSPVVAERPAAPPAPASDGHAWIWLTVAAVVVAASAAGALYVAGRPHTP